MDVVTTYLYGSLDTVYIGKSLKDFKMPESCQSSHCNLYSIKLQKSFYGLKQSGSMSYNRLSEYLIKKRIC